MAANSKHVLKHRLQKIIHTIIKSKLGSPVSRACPVALNNCVLGRMASQHKTWFPQATLSITYQQGSAVLFVEVVFPASKP